MSDLGEIARLRRIEALYNRLLPELNAANAELAGVRKALAHVEVQYVTPGDTVTLTDQAEQLVHDARNSAEDCARVKEHLAPLYPDEPDKVRAGWLARECAAPEIRMARVARAENVR